MATPIQLAKVPTELRLQEYHLLTQEPPAYPGPAHAIIVSLRTVRALHAPFEPTPLQAFKSISRIPLYDRTLLSDSVQICITCCPNHAFQYGLPYDTTTSAPRLPDQHRPTVLTEIEPLTHISPLTTSDTVANYAFVLSEDSRTNLAFSLIRAVCPCCSEHAHALGLLHRTQPRYGALMTTEPTEEYVPPHSGPSYHPASIFYAPPFDPSNVPTSLPSHETHPYWLPPKMTNTYDVPPQSTRTLSSHEAEDPHSMSPLTASSVKRSIPSEPDNEMDPPTSDPRPQTSTTSSSGLLSQIASLAPSDSLSAKMEKMALQHKDLKSTSAAPKLRTRIQLPGPALPVEFPAAPKELTRAVDLASPPDESPTSRRQKAPMPTFSQSYEIHSLHLLLCRYFSVARSNHGKMYKLIKAHIFDPSPNAVIELNLSGITAEFSLLRTHLHDFHATQFASPDPPTKKTNSLCPIKGCLFFPREFGRSDLTIIQSGFKSQKSSEHLKSIMRSLPHSDSDLIAITVDASKVDISSQGFDTSLFATHVPNHAPS
jgi:hypothetical protein